MAALALGNLVRPLARLQTEVHHDVLDSLVQGLEGEAVGVLQLVLLPELLPRGPEVALHDPLDVVRHGDVEVLQLVLVIVPLVTVRLPGGGIAVLHRELERGGHGGDALGQVLGHGEHGVDGGGDVVLHGGGGHLGHHLPPLPHLELHADPLQQLVRQRVGAVELQHHVARVHVLDAGHRVLRLRLGQLHRLAGPEERAQPQLLQLRHPAQLLHEHVVSGGRGGGLVRLAGQPHRGHARLLLLDNLRGN